MAITLVQSQIGRNVGAGNLATSFSGTPTTGNLVVVMIAIDGAIGTVTDNQSGNTYTAAQETSSGLHVAVWRAPNVNATGTFTVTVTGGNAKTVVIAECGSAATVSPGDGGNGTTGSDATAETGNITTTNADDILIGLVGTDQGNTDAITPDTGAGWATVREEEDGGSFFAASGASRIVAATSTYAHVWTLAGAHGWITALAAFKGAAGAAQDTPELRGRPFGQRGQRHMHQLLAQ